MLSVVAVVISNGNKEVEYFGKKVQFVNCRNIAEFNLIIAVRRYLAEVISLNFLIPCHVLSSNT